MFPRPFRTSSARQPLAILLAFVALALSACAGASAPSFNPSGPCDTDGRVAGAYPDLESKLPITFEGGPATSVDSGRHCSLTALGSLITHNVSGVQFAGATWDLGAGTALSSAVFRLPDADLPAAWIEEFYEIGARTAKRTENIEVSRPTFPGPGRVFRLDTLNSLSLQTVLVWQDGPLVRVVLVATPVALNSSRAAHDDLVSRAVMATATISTPASSTTDGWPATDL